MQIFPFDMNRSPSQLWDIWRIRVYLESKTFGGDMNVFHFGIQIFPFDMNRSPSQLCDVWRIRVYLESKTIGEDNF